jgi:hypothetical protein
MSQLFTADTTVRHILHSYPHAYEVFESHGMCEDCKDDPPPLPLSHFAGRHGVAVNDLIRQLEAVVRQERELEEERKQRGE